MCGEQTFFSLYFNCIANHGGYLCTDHEHAATYFMRHQVHSRLTLPVT
jgi:hypothetical protein